MKLIRLIARSGWANSLRIITCSGKHCNRWLTLKHLAARKVGIKMSDCWYCGPDCFTPAAERQFSHLASSVPAPSNHVSRMPLGLMMVSRGLLTNEDLRRAVDEQKQTGEEIGEVLIRLELVSEKQVAAVRAAQWGCPTFSVPKGATPAEVVIPATLVAEHSMVPLHYVAATNQLLVGFVQSIEYGILYAIEQILGCKTQPCFVTPSDFQGQMFQREQLQKLELTPSELKFESGHSASDMARILSSYSLHLHADEAVIGKCSGFMWARLKTGPRAVDLLFKVA